MNLVKPIKILVIRLSMDDLEIPLDRSKVLQLRGAIAKKVGFEVEAFHNHNNAENATVHYHYRYPVIQYKWATDDLVLVCIGEGVEAIQHFFEKPDWTLHVGGQRVRPRVADLRLMEYVPNFAESAVYEYRIVEWYALSQENYKVFQSIRHDKEAVIPFLEKILTNAIVYFLNGVGCSSEEAVRVSIGDFYIRDEYHKQQKVLVFNVLFSSNLRLPEWIGLGKACAMGFGVVRKNG